MYFCEDHFDLENDMEIYEQDKTNGLVNQVRLKPNCVPTRFNCQKDRIKFRTSNQQPPFLVFSSKKQPVQQTQMPILLTLLPEDNPHFCLPADVTDTALLITLLCVCCLARDVPFIRLVTCCHAEFVNSMMMPEIKLKNQVICYQCHDMLKKIKQFKLQVQESFKLLSDSSENIPKNSNQRLNHRPSNLSMVIPNANRKEKPVKHYNATIPHTIRIKPNIRNDHINVIEENEAKDKTEKSPISKNLEKKDKLIKQAFKIINSNQNSKSINLLANSLQNLSSTLLSEMICPNFDLGSQINTTLPAEINIGGNKVLTSNVTTSSTENITSVNEENALIAETTNVDVTPANSTEKITDVKENAIQDDCINDQNVNIKDTVNNTNDLEEIAFEAASSNIAANLAISSENLINLLNTSSHTENLKKTKTENKSPGCYSVNDYTINFTDENMSIEELTNIIKDDETITCDTYGFDDDDSSDEDEELKQPVTEETEKKESVEGVINNLQPVGTPIALDAPILAENIKQLTLTREQLVEERAKTATSLAREALCTARPWAVAHTAHALRRLCTSCIIGFQFYENLKDHFKRKHTRMPGKRREVKCDVCQQFVEHGAIFNMHTFYHHTRYQCGICEQLFESYDKATLHYKRQHSAISYIAKDTFKCPRCPYKTSRQHLLNDHITECSTCKQCGVSIGTMADISLETHLIYCTAAPPEAKRAKPTPTSTATEALEE